MTPLILQRIQFTVLPISLIPQENNCFILCYIDNKSEFMLHQDDYGYKGGNPFKNYF